MIYFSRWRTYLLLFLLFMAVAGGRLWWTHFSPYGYQTPASYSISYSDEPQRVFVYGTLRHPALRWLVTGQSLTTRPAILPNYRKQGLDIVPAPDDHTEGLVFYVDQPSLRRLDRYERLGIHYTRERLPLADGDPAWVYRRM